MDGECDFLAALEKEYERNYGEVDDDCEEN
jgi:hypothetical protein